MNVRREEVNLSMPKIYATNHRWLDRCFNRFKKPDKYGYTQNLFPIVQGGVHTDLRKASCEYISSKAAVGNAIGGLSVESPSIKCMRSVRCVVIICQWINHVTSWGLVLPGISLKQSKWV
jgi:tRNA-guanine family transglycosylase